MKRFIAFNLCAIMIILSIGCAPKSGVSSGEASQSIGSSAVSSSDAPSQAESQVVESVSEPASGCAEKEIDESTENIASEDSDAKLNPSTEQVPIVLTEEEARQELYMSNLPAKQSWHKAYETFYSGGIDLTKDNLNEVWLTRQEHGVYQTNDKLDAICLRSDSGIDFIYPIYEMSYEHINTVTTNGSQAAIARKCAMKTQEYGFLANYLMDNSFAGEGIVLTAEDKAEIIMQGFSPFAVGDYRYRTSLTVTEGVEAQLLDMGFAPDRTSAFALRFSDEEYGVCFFDEEKAAYYNNCTTFGMSLNERLYSFEELEKALCDIYDVCSVSEIEHTKRQTSENINEVEAPIEVPTEAIANPSTAKPVIYLYPQQPTEISVKLGYPKEFFTYTYPAYNDGWQVLAQPDGTLTNLSDGSEHYYLFWEGDKRIDWNFSQGFVVKGSDIEVFLREKLKYLGLVPREYNDFITYWAPELSQNEYNLITFSTEQYEKLAPLEISPAPDSVLRVHMVYKAIDAPIEIKPQALQPWQRSGFAVVEWGGSRA